MGSFIGGDTASEKRFCNRGFRPSLEELRSTLEDWLLLGLQLGHELPVIDGLDLNRKPAPEEPAYAEAH